MNVREWLEKAAGILTQSGSPDPMPDARLIAEWAADNDRLGLGEELSPEALGRAEHALEERVTGRPVQYIIGSAWFYGRKFKSDERALIPRFDTEILCEKALSLIKKHHEPSVLDVCTGSGAIGLTIKCERPRASVTLSDISEAALALANENAERLACRVRSVCGDLFEPFGAEEYDMICINPPYITADEMDTLPREVTYEPRLALCGGADGLDIYRRIANEVGAYLKMGGTLLVEIGAMQAASVTGLLKAEFPDALFETVRDLQGLDRVVVMRRI